MSFDVFLVSFRNGEKADADAAAAREVLEQFQYIHRPEFDAYVIKFADGSHLEMYAGGLHSAERFDGGMFALRGLSDAIGAFIFRFSQAAGCVIFPAMNPPCVILPRGDLAAHLPSNLGGDYQRISVANGGEMLAALNGGYDTWLAYRNRVLGGAGDPAGGI